MTAHPPFFLRDALPCPAEAIGAGRGQIVASRRVVARPAGAATLLADQGGGGQAPRVDAPLRAGARPGPFRLWLAGGAVGLSTVLHGGLVAALVALGGAVPPLSEPDVETAEVALISEAQFMAMTAPKPAVVEQAPAMAAPATLPASLDAPEAIVTPAAPDAPLAAAPISAPGVTPPTDDPAPVAQTAPAPVPAKPTVETPRKAEVPAPPQPVAEPKPKPEPAAKVADSGPAPKAAPPAQQKAKPAAKAAAPGLSKGEAKALKADWGAKIASRIKRKLVAPADAAPGRVKLQVTLSPKGALLGVEVIESSGQRALDAAAVKAAKAAAPYPRAPKGLTEASYSFTLPIRQDG